MQNRKARVLGWIVSAALLLIAAGAVAQDRQWVAQWEGAQRERPANVGSVGRIAPANEPGTPMIIHGRVFQSDGTTPAEGITVFAYQTDRTGIYNERGTPGWRLRGWAKSDAAGRFEFRTIRPGSYPRGRVPAHVHLTIEGSDLPRRWTGELRFADDPYLREADRRAAAEKFGSVREVTVRDGVQHVDLNLRIENEGRF